MVSKNFREWFESSKTSEHVSEEYMTGVTPKYSKNNYYEIFKNPDSSEMRDLAGVGAFARFIAIGNDIYVFPAELLHASAIEELKLKISDNPPIRTAFLGVAKISGQKLTLHVTNQAISPEDAANVEKFHPAVKKFFTQ